MSYLKVQNLSIQFPGVKALDGVSFEIDKGECVAFCGENGAGKSTLGKIVSGVYTKNVFDITGTIIFKGEERDFKNTREAEELGIEMVHQELNLFNEMTIGENIFMNNFPNKAGIVNFEQMYNEAKEFLREMDLNVDPKVKIKDLTVSQSQIIEIVATLSRDPELIIFDEATASLTNKEIEILFNIIKRLKAEKTTIIYVTHKLEEIFEICDSVIILKDGQFVEKKYLDGTIKKDDIIEGMVGRKLEKMYPDRPSEKKINEIMKIMNWNVLDHLVPEKKLVDNVSLNINSGEILGLYGLVGSGRTELVMSIFKGDKEYASGEIYIDNNKVDINNPACAIEHGISLITEDRKENALVLLRSIKENIVLASLKKHAKYGVIDEKEELNTVNKYMAKLQVKAASIDQLVMNLSGGNQQKVVISKWLINEPNILILDEPTKGIDVGAKAEIYQILRELADQGIAVVMISSEIPEILGVSDKIAVMRDGEICTLLNAEEADEDKLIKYAMGR